MARVVPLNDTKIKNLKPKDKEYKVADGDGLYLHVTPTGSKIWKMRYRVGKGATSTLSIGKYPAVTLANARKEREHINHQVAIGEKPTTIANHNRVANLSFKAISEAYFNNNSDHLSKDYLDNNRRYIKNHYANIENMDVNDITHEHILRSVIQMNQKGIIETAKRTSALLDRIFKYAVTTRKMKRNPMSEIDVSVILGKTKVKHFSHITDPAEFGELLSAIDEYSGDLTTKTALQLMPYVFLRPQNIRFATWDEIDFNKKIWVIPASKMKMERDHIVPLTDTMIEILKRVEGLSDNYVFPSQLYRERPLSENTLNIGLKRLGYKGIMTTHGFRHSASTFLNENAHKHNVSSDVIEVQLAHVESNKIKGVYNKAMYLEERTRLMEWWSDYLDALKLSS